MKATQMSIDLEPIFPIRIHVGFKDIAAFEKYIAVEISPSSAKKHIRGIEKDKVGAAALFYKGTFTIFIYDNENKPRIHLEEIIPHEVFHITMRICNYLGITYSNESEEVFAYINGYINSVILSNREMYEGLESESSEVKDSEPKSKKVKTLS